MIQLGIRAAYTMMTCLLARPALWFISWFDISISPNLALVNHLRSNAKDPEVAAHQFAVIAPG